MTKSASAKRGASWALSGFQFEIRAMDAPIPKLLPRRAQVTLGRTDPPAATTLTVEGLRVAAILHRGVHQDPGLTPARQITA